MEASAWAGHSLRSSIVFALRAADKRLILSALNRGNNVILSSTAGAVLACGIGHVIASTLVILETDIRSVLVIEESVSAVAIVSILDHVASA